jgi:hypothetical protein
MSSIGDGSGGVGMRAQGEALVGGERGFSISIHLVPHSSSLTFRRDKEGMESVGFGYWPALLKYGAVVRLKLLAPG